MPIDPKFIEIYRSIRDKAMPSKQCQSEHCKSQYAASEIVAQKADKYVLRKKNLSAYEKNQLKNERIMAAPETRALMECSINACYDSLVAYMKEMLKLVQYGCKTGDDSACETLKKARAITRKKKITIDDYVEYVRLLATLKP